MNADIRRPPTGDRPGILDVAALAGVSPATVSRSLRGQSKVAPETRQRVLDAARELSYVASPQASGLASGRTRAVAVVVPFITRWFFSTVVAGVTDVLRESGYDVILYHLGSAADRDRFFERMPLARRVDGILTLSMPLTDEHTLALRALDIPLVSVGSPVPGVPSVRIDEIAAAQTAVNHLIHQGHERIAFIAGVPDDPDFGFVSSELRHHGYRLALEAAGLSIDDNLSVAGPYGLDGGGIAMAQLLSGSVLPTAVFAEYDELAMGALWALRRAGLAVPHQMSVVGIDNHEMSQLMDLTTVAQSPHTQGTTAAHLLLESLASPTSTPPPEVVLPTHLVLRATSAPPFRRTAARKRR
ncbi:LacI family DNA-binding transcriptional regulator [Kribbella sp. VKM Ac-2568]|uniref:LacI family DNA-binding transcriptional regulator n=1 Tax=Kribbella sp. VKM Ac-2568 TaxID=2512219 RepID=UPI0010E43A04|nr:LacI family DNA-binding transcriptional regulator [Kribbella sp. VKM Ac-2568]TCM38921.1 DNA-binding LacI/PurR family transcriptional regulator [Kribbella sp. VKM Ac-2568]